MKISLNWIKNYLDINFEITTLAETLPMAGLVVNSISSIKKLNFKNTVIVGEVLTIDKHPNADKLSICQILIDTTNNLKKQVICGDLSLKIGEKVVIALIGAKLPNITSKIKKSKIRGIYSYGMLCSGQEIDINQSTDKIIILKKDLKVGLSIDLIFNQQNDYILDLEITSNRSDLLSHIGVARELATIYNLSFKNKLIKNKNILIEENLIHEISIQSDYCSNYNLIFIKNIQVKSSPEWLKNSLEKINQKSINNIVDIANWIMMDIGQPMHIFDLDKINDTKIFIRQAKKGEKIIALDKKEYLLDESMTVIADSKKVIAIAGIIGSLDSSVDNKTVNIIVEIGCFNHINISQTSKKLNINTESAYRFSRKVDFKNNLLVSSASIINLIKNDFPKAKFYSSFKKINFKEKINTISISSDFINKKLGFEIPDQIIFNILKRLNFIVVNCINQKWEILIPSYRNNVLAPIDIVEELLRIYGTQNIPIEKPIVKGLNRNDDILIVLIKKIKDYLISKSFNECYSYSLNSELNSKIWFKEETINNLSIQNPINKNYTHLRLSLIPCLYNIFKYNQDHDNKVKNLFEIGNIFKFFNNKIYEFLSISFIMGPILDKNTWSKIEDTSFFEIKNILLDIIFILKINKNKLNLRFFNEKMWKKNYSACSNNILEDGFSLKIGYLNDSFSKNLKNNVPILGCELLINPLNFNLKDDKKIFFKPFSVYPSSKKDLSVIVNKDILSDEVINTILKIANQISEKECIVEDIQLFDLYYGKSISKDKKSFTLSINYRAFNRTLEEKEINIAFKKLQDEIKIQTSYLIRSE